jgi:hypothetical protein
MPLKEHDKTEVVHPNKLIGWVLSIILFGGLLYVLWKYIPWKALLASMGNVSHK